MGKLKSYECGNCIHIQPMITTTGKINFYCIPMVEGKVKKKWINDCLICLSKELEV